MKKSTAPMDIQAALRKLDSWQGEPTQGPQRRFRRFPVRGEARLWPGEAGSNPPPPAIVQIRDISRGGVGLLSNEPVQRGHISQMQLVASTHTLATEPDVSRNGREVIEYAYLIGVEFGIQASVMLALGVVAKDLAEGDEIEDQRPLTGEFVDPKALIDSDAA